MTALGDYIYPGRTPRFANDMQAEVRARRAILIAAYAIETYELRPEYDEAFAKPANADAQLIEECMFGVTGRPHGVHWLAEVHKRVETISRVGWNMYCEAQKALPVRTRTMAGAVGVMLDIALEGKDDYLLPLRIHGEMRKKFPQADLKPPTVQDTRKRFRY